jgi:ferric-dicitrate binding protein FerR (iron transport regulator)
VYNLGDATMSRGASTTEVFPGLELARGDVLRTGSDGVVVIRMEGGTELKLREETSLALETLDQTVTVSLNSGGLFSRVVRKAGGLSSAFRVRTPSAVAGVRGTEFFVAYGRTVDQMPDLWLCVNEGSVDVSIPDTGKSVVVNEGEGISIVGGLKLTQPRFYPWTRRLNWNFNAEAGAVEDRTNIDQAYSDLLDQDYD